MKKWLAIVFVVLVLMLLWTQTAEEKRISSLTFEELEKAVMNSDLTEIQEEEVRSRYIGERVRWTGEVLEVTTEGLVSVDLDGLASDVEFYLPTAKALTLSVGQGITFVGTIEAIDVGVFDCDVRLESVTLEESAGLTDARIPGA